LTLLAGHFYTRGMRRFLLLFAVAVAAASQAAAGPPVIRLVRFDTEITAASASRIVDALDEAGRDRNDLVLIELDTPGGAVEATGEIVKKMLAATTPIAVWVGPPGARAASGGMFLLIAADVAAMAPGTRTGASSVINMLGKNDQGDVALKKLSSDMAALGRSIAEHRKRNVDLVERAVMSAEAFTDATAREAGLVDLVAKDRDDLLAQLDGRPLRRFDGTETVVRTAGATFVERDLSRTQRFMEWLASPTIAFLLLLVGLGGLYLELTTPGAILPGLVGATCLILFAFAARALPFSVAGLLLILLGLVMFVLEIKVTSYGLLTLGGIACIVLGSMMLFPGPIPELRLPLAVVLPGALLLAGGCAVAMRLALRAQRERVTTGVEGLPGEIGLVTRDVAPGGKVLVHGELWDAVTEGEAIARGQRARVVRVDDMVLRVEAVADGSPRRR
jgi:membrane-bound serine protease (ClpP class)